MRNKILFVGTFIMPDKNAAAIRVLGIAKALRKEGFEVVFQGNQIDDAEPTKVVDNYVDGFLYKTREKWSSKEYYFDDSYIRKTVESLNKATVCAIIMYHSAAILSIRLNTYCKKNGIKLIADITEWYDIKRQLNSGHIAIRALDFWTRVYIANPHIGNIIAISSYLENYYIKKKCNTIKVPILDITENKDIKIEKTDFNIHFCYCGSPTQKDMLLPIVENAVELINNGIRNFDLQIVGITQEQFETNNNLKIDSKYLEWIKFYGRVPHEEAVNILSKSDYSFIIRPSMRYAIAGFPTKMVEAFSVGVAVIACSNGDIPDYVKNNVNGFLINPNNIYEDLEKIMKLVTSLSTIEVNKMKRNSLQTAREKFDFSYYAAPLKEYLNGI